MRDHPNAIMFFAAGFGTRMGPFTKDRPKPLVQVANRALIDHAIALTDDLKLAAKVVNCHYFPDQIKAHLATRDDITVVHEDGEILETGGGLKNALPHLGTGPVFTSNTDAVWKGANPLRELLAAWDPEKMDALLLCVPKENAVGYSGAGDFLIDQEARLTYGPGDIYTGVQIIRTDRLSEIEQSSFSFRPLYWAKFLESKRMYGVRYSGQWCDVGTPEGVELAENMLENCNV